MNPGSRIAGVGSYLPRTVIRNDFFGNTVRKSVSQNLDDLFDGVHERRHADSDETSIFMGTEAARKALAHAKLQPQDIDYVLSCSMAPDYVVPGDGPFIARELGIKNAVTLTMDTACASMISMIAQADLLIKMGRATRVLLISTCNWVNRVIDKQRNYGCLGDGAGAIVIESAQEESLLAFHETTESKWAHAIQVKAPWATGVPESFQFHSDDEFRDYNLNGRIVSVARECLIDCRKKGLRPRWNICGQSGLRMIQTWNRNLEMELEDNLNTIAHTGNLAATNLPVILDHYLNVEPKIQKGDAVLMFAPGAGVYTAGLVWKF